MASTLESRGAADDQVLLMTTCMETLIVADRAALTEHYGAELQARAPPALINLETRQRHDVQDALVHATRNCTNAYAKGKRSFEILAKLAPATLETTFRALLGRDAFWIKLCSA